MPMMRSISDQQWNRRRRRVALTIALTICMIVIITCFAPRKRTQIDPDQWHSLVDSIGGDDVDLDVPEECEELTGYEEDGYHGFKNSNGKVVIEPHFIRASHYFIQCRAWAQDEIGIGIIDTTGKFVSAMRFDIVEDYSYGRALVGKTQPNGWMKYGFVDLQGRLVVPCKYDYADRYYKGYALVGNEVFMSRIQRDIGHPGGRQIECVLIDRHGAKRLGVD